jgi:N-carbamoyl-L-amino-acid hydrolase
MLARVCPTAMIFTPSAGGLSHNIAEYTSPDDVGAGADVLLQTLLTLAGTPDDPVGGSEGESLAE